MTSVCSSNPITFFEFMPSGILVAKKLNVSAIIFSIQGDGLVGTSELSFLISAFSRLLDLYEGETNVTKENVLFFLGQDKGRPSKSPPNCFVSFLAQPQGNPFLLLLVFFVSFSVSSGTWCAVKRKMLMLLLGVSCWKRQNKSKRRVAMLVIEK